MLSAQLRELGLRDGPGAGCVGCGGGGGVYINRSLLSHFASKTATAKAGVKSVTLSPFVQKGAAERAAARMARESQTTPRSRGLLIAQR